MKRPMVFLVLVAAGGAAAAVAVPQSFLWEMFASSRAKRKRKEWQTEKL